MNKFKPASAEELARRGLNPDGTPLKAAESKSSLVKKLAPKKAAPKKED